MCGLGNPLSFRRTLESLGVAAVDWVEFPDHHRYRPDELRRVAQQAAARGATALVTTEKDVMNLPDDWAPLVAPLELYWLRVAMAIDREAEFFEWIAAADGRAALQRGRGGHDGPKGRPTAWQHSETACPFTAPARRPRITAPAR